MTKGGGFYAEESWDGRFLYYTRSESNGSIWRVPVEGGEEREVARGPEWWGDWAVSRTRLYYLQRQVLRPRRSRFAIRSFDLRSGTETELFRSEEGPFGREFLAVSPDEKWILYGEAPYVTSELMLADNSR